MRTPGDKTSSKVIIVGIIVLGFVAAYLISFVFRDADPLANVCLEVLPKNQRVGMKFEKQPDVIKIDLSGQRGVETGATPEQMEGFVKCLEVASRAKVTVEDGVRLSLEPVGQVANRWKRESGIHLRLLPGSN